MRALESPGRVRLEQETGAQNLTRTQQKAIVGYLEVLKMERLVSIKHAAAILSVSPEFLKKLQRDGRLRIVRLGRAVRIPRTELGRLAALGTPGRKEENR